MIGESQVAAWPPTPEQRQHLMTLAQLIKRFGAARFTATPLVRADTRDFPDAWEPTLAALHRVMYRLYWHAHVDAEIAIEDVRPAKAPEYKMLETSTIELGKVEAGRVSYHVEVIGNDDVAGLLSHTVGAAFLELAPVDPFRDAQPHQASEVEASIAAIYLGLGVLVANASMYRRHASKVVGRSVVSEDLIAVTGGLSIGDATMLLAVQDALRDDHQDALATLHAPQAEWIAKWRDVFDPHEDELRALLELDDAGGELPARAPAPRTPSATPAERDLRKFNAGRKTFRVQRRKRGRSSLGVVVGAFGFALPFGWYLGPAAMVGGLVAGHYLSGHVFECADPKCSAVMETEVDVCPRCGGTIVETLARASQRLDRLEELEGEPGFDYGQHDERRADV